MRLSDILSRPISGQFSQIEGFLGEKKVKNGTHKKIEIGTLGLSFFCKNCDETTLFCAGGENDPALYCVVINDKLISIDCSLKCPRCGCFIPTWFLIESKDSMFMHSVDCRILMRRENLSDTVMYHRPETFGEYTDIIEKANVAHREGLGAGAMVYLRKTFEQITTAAANGAGISKVKENGYKKNTKDLIKEVNEQCHIMPHDFSKNGYQLFSELSEVLHGDSDENLGLEKYEYLRRLIVGIIENIKNNNENADLRRALGW